MRGAFNHLNLIPDVKKKRVRESESAAERLINAAENAFRRSHPDGDGIALIFLL